MGGTNWHFLALADCYEPNRSKVSRQVKCQVPRVPYIVISVLLWDYRGYYNSITRCHIVLSFWALFWALRK